MPSFLAALLLGASLAAPVLPDADHRPDAWVTMKAKMALVGALGADGLDVNVDTLGGVVTLHGRLPTEERRAEALAAVRRVEGVHEVRDLVQVVPDALREAVDARDEDLLRDVRAALEGDPVLKDSGIEAASVSDGVVLLRGEARRLGDQLRALRLAARVPGVRSVASEVRFDEASYPFEDEISRSVDALRDAARDARDVTRDVVRDAWITMDVKLRFMADADVPALDLNVDTDDGVVTLFGSVAGESSRQRALEVARSVPGVREVRDALRVDAGRSVAGILADDRLLSARLAGLFESRRASLGDGIDVSVDGGVVTLRGVVRRPLDRYTASTLARQAGARAVVNELEVSPGAGS